MNKEFSKMECIEFLALADVKLRSYEEDGFSALTLQQALKTYYNLLSILESVVSVDYLETDADVSEDSLTKTYIDSVLLVIASQVNSMSDLKEPITLNECKLLRSAFHMITDNILPVISFSMAYYTKNILSLMKMKNNINGSVDVTKNEIKLISMKQEEIVKKGDHFADIYALLIDYNHLINNMLDIKHSVLRSKEFKDSVVATAKFYERLEYSINEYVSDVNVFKWDVLDNSFNFIDFIKKADEIRKKNKDNIVKLRGNIDKNQ